MPTASKKASSPPRRSRRAAAARDAAEAAVAKAWAPAALSLTEQAYRQIEELICTLHCRRARS